MSPGASAIFGDKLFEKILFMNVENHKWLGAGIDPCVRFLLTQDANP